MTAGKLILWIAVTFTAVVVAAGLYMVGGPGQARADDRDKDRFDDLTQFRDVLECHYRDAGTFPATFEKSAILAKCRARFPDPRDLVDPKTGEPYTYERLSPQSVRFCATFEGSQDRLKNLIGREVDGFSIESGCYSLLRE